MRHRLLVMRAVGRQLIARAPQRLAEAGDVAMAEDRPDAGEQRLDAALALRPLRREVAHERLRHGETEGHGGPYLSPLAGRGRTRAWGASG